MQGNDQNATIVYQFMMTQGYITTTAWLHPGDSLSRGQQKPLPNDSTMIPKQASHSVYFEMMCISFPELTILPNKWVYYLCKMKLPNISDISGQLILFRARGSGNAAAGYR